MSTKTTVLYVLVSVVCLAPGRLTSSQKTDQDLTENPQISEGEFTAPINGLTLWYKVSGQGPVCIFPTPGHGPSSELYFLSCSPLEEMFTMVYLDTRGSGRSQRPELSEYTMRNFVADIEGIRRQLGIEQVWLMGHSNGGKMVLHYASAYPNRVTGMILVDTKVASSSNGGRTQRMQLRKDEPWFDAAMEHWKKQPRTQEELDTNMMMTLPFFFSSIENLEKQKEVFNQTSVSLHARRGQMRSGTSSADLLPWLSEMDIPTLIIVGTGDFISPPSAAQLLHREIRNSKLLVIEHAGHFPWMEEPKQFFGGIRDFLPKLGYRRD